MNADHVCLPVGRELEAAMPDRTMMIDGVRVSRFFYGTAWKKDETTRLTALALGQGFRGIDTANQRKHYHVGEKRSGGAG